MLLGLLGLFDCYLLLALLAWPAFLCTGAFLSPSPESSLQPFLQDQGQGVRRLHEGQLQPYDRVGDFSMAKLGCNCPGSLLQPRCQQLTGSLVFAATESRRSLAWSSSINSKIASHKGSKFRGREPLWELGGKEDPGSVVELCWLAFPCPPAAVLHAPARGRLLHVPLPEFQVTWRIP